MDKSKPIIVYINKKKRDILLKKGVLDKSQLNFTLLELEESLRSNMCHTIAMDSSEGLESRYNRMYNILLNLYTTDLINMMVLIYGK